MTISDKIAIIATAVAFGQFGALIATWLVMISNGRRQLRAYIGISGDKKNWPRIATAGNKLRGVVEIKNFGATPAYNVQVSTHIKIREYPLLYSLLMDDRRPSRSATVLHPGEMLVVQYDSDEVSSEELQLVVKGDSAAFSYGEIIYRDIFKRRRRTRFCVYLTGQPVDLFHPTFLWDEGNSAT